MALPRFVNDLAVCHSFRIPRTGIYVGVSEICWLSGLGEQLLLLEFPFKFWFVGCVAGAGGACWPFRSGGELLLPVLSPKPLLSVRDNSFGISSKVACVLWLLARYADITLEVKCFQFFG